MSRANSMNYKVKDGTVVGFTASARLRRIEDGLMKEERLDDGALIGEGKRGRILARVESRDRVGYVVEVDGGFYGWVFPFEFHVA